MCYISGLTFLIKTKYMRKCMQTHNHYLNTTFTIIMAVITIPTPTICAINAFVVCCIEILSFSISWKFPHTWLLPNTHSLFVLLCIGSQCYYDYFFLQLNLCHCLLFACFVTFHEALSRSHLTFNFWTTLWFSFMYFLNHENHFLFLFSIFSNVLF